MTGPGEVKVRVGVDVGGTFTDLVAVTPGGVVTAKVPSIPSDQSAAVAGAIETSGLDPTTFEWFAHGTTVATNALLERKGARTALVTTEGFRDVIEIGRQNRPSLYDLTKDRPPPLVPRDLRFTVAERMGPDGVLEPLDEETLEQAIQRLRGADVEAVAVVTLISFLHPLHEKRIAEAIRAALPDVAVAASHEVLPEFREYERTATTVADAYLRPPLASYLSKLAAMLGATGVATPFVMQSSGGVIQFEDALDNAAACVLSGPAGGVIGATYVAQAGGVQDVLTFDMGGTSTDVCAAREGDVERTSEAIVAGVPIRLPMVDVHTVSAGGGSIAWIDEGGVLHVGPHSAGADPGPACYGRGGADATVSDANLVLGYLEGGMRLGGEVVLRAELARKALDRLGAEIGLSAEDAALGVVAVANTEMVRALRVITVQRGLDPRDFTLVAFGGAGPMHALALAEELGMAKVLIPKAGGVLSALGLAIASPTRDHVGPVHAFLDDVDEGLDALYGELETRASDEFDGQVLFRREADLRYRGQAYELTIDYDDVDEADPLRSLFETEHERRYGYRMTHEQIEIVSLRVRAVAEQPLPRLTEDEPDGDPQTSTRSAVFDRERFEVPVLDRDRMGNGSHVSGPAIVESRGSTLVVRPGWSGRVDASGNLLLETTG
ncbi:MAG: hydantoinase/oxoprolinase family protein [Actinomycetota bacterium]